MPIITEEDGRSFLAAHLKPDQLDQLLYDIDGHGRSGSQSKIGPSPRTFIKSGISI